MPGDPPPRIAAGVAPSILSADFARLGEQVAEVLDAGARVIHVDVMDGHFVPPITIGPLVVEALAERSTSAAASLDVHLMIERPERQVAEFAEAGADAITSTSRPRRTSTTRSQHDPRRGLPGRARDQPRRRRPRWSREVVDDVDLVLCMTVNPGWGGQPFIAELAREDRAPARAGRAEPCGSRSTAGSTPRPLPACAAAGANVFVAGSAVFSAPDPAQAWNGIAAVVENASQGVRSAV